MSMISVIFILIMILQTAAAGAVGYFLAVDGAYLSVAIIGILILLSIIIGSLTFWTKKLKYLFYYIFVMILWTTAIVFLFLDIFGIFHILQPLDNLLIGKSAIENYKNNKGLNLSLLFFLFIALMVLMVVSTILSCFVPLTKTVKQTDEYGNVIRGSKVISIYNDVTKNKYDGDSPNNSDMNLDGDPGIQIIPNNNFYNTLNYNNERKNYNDYNLLPDDSPYNSRNNLNRDNSGNNLNLDDLRQMKSDTRLRMDDELYTPPEPNNYLDDERDIKFNTLSSAKPDRSMYGRNYINRRSNTWDKNFASRRAQEARENNDKERTRDKIRERERERMRENRRERDRTNDEEDYDDNDYRDEEENDDELSPTNIKSKKELERYLRKSTYSIMSRRSGGGNPKFVSMFEIEENASEVSEEEEFSMNNFTIKCKICKKDIPIEDVENHKCESENIPLINIETEEHKKERLQKEKEEKEKKEKERKRKERSEREKRRLRSRDRDRRDRDRKDRDRDRDRDRRRDERSRDRDRKRDEKSRDRDRKRDDERSRDRDRDRKRRGDRIEHKHSTRDRDHDRSRSRDNSREIDRSHSRSRDNSRDEIDRSRSRDKRRNEEKIREGKRYDISTEYEQVLDDEVTVKKGHTFEVEKIFEDGWCVGTNLSTNKWGAIPMNCLSSKQERRRRIQSLYMA